MKTKCAYCNKRFEIMTGHFNRAKSIGLKVYCSVKHSNIGRRLHKTKNQKAEEKWWYDAFNRLFMADEIRKKKAAYFKRDYKSNPEKYRTIRVAKRDKHNEYCRQPHYRQYKRTYDRTYRAKKFYGPMADAYLVLLDLEREIDNRQAIKDNNISNKNQKRKRQWQQKINHKSNLASLLRA